MSSSVAKLLDFAPKRNVILEGRTNLPERLFEAFFNVSSLKSSTHALEKCFEKTLRKVCSVADKSGLGDLAEGSCD